MKTGSIEYEITEDSEIFPVLHCADGETAIGTQMGKRLAFKDADYFLFVRAVKNEEIGKTDFLLVCGITGTRTSRVRWSIERCLEDFIEGMKTRGHIDAKEFRACAESIKPEFAAMIKEWWSNGGPRG